MPKIVDLQAAVDEVQASVDAAADRVIALEVVEVPQGIVDQLFLVKSKADSILPPE